MTINVFTVLLYFGLMGLFMWGLIVLDKHWP